MVKGVYYYSFDLVDYWLMYVRLRCSLTLSNGKKSLFVSDVIIMRVTKLRPTSTSQSLTYAHSRSATERRIYPLVSFVSVMVMHVSMSVRYWSVTVMKLRAE